MLNRKSEHCGLAKRKKDYSILLVIVSVMDDYEAEVKTFAQVEQVVCLCFSPTIIMEMHLIFLL